MSSPSPAPPPDGPTAASDGPATLGDGTAGSPAVPAVAPPRSATTYRAGVPTPVREERPSLTPRPALGAVGPAEPPAARGQQPPTVASGEPSGAQRPAVAPAPSSPRPEGTVYRAARRPGLTTPGVAVLTTAVALLSGLISTVVTGGLGWLFGVPLALISGYCAWEVRESDRRSSLLAPPLTLLVVAVVSSLVGDGWLGVTGTAVSVLTTLVSSAPMLVVAEVVVGGVLLARYLRRRRNSRP